MSRAKEGSVQRSVQLEIDPLSVATARRELRSIVAGNAIAEAAVAGFSDWEAVRALERMWGVALGADQAEPDKDERGLPGAPRQQRPSRAR